LQSRYQVKFQARFGPATSLNNHEYLPLLDRLWQVAGLAPPVRRLVRRSGL
jgi:hypothetical protein